MFFLLTITPVQHYCGSGWDLLVPEEDLKSGRGVWMRLQSHSTYPTKQIQNSQCKHKFKSFPNPIFLHKTILPYKLTRYFYTYFCKQIFTNLIITVVSAQKFLQIIILLAGKPLYVIRFCRQFWEGLVYNFIRVF